MSNQFGNYLEDFKENQLFKHSIGKTITESDNNLFSLLTMNHHPVHLDWDYCNKNQHGQVLVVGTLVFSLVVGFTVGDISGKAIANLGYEDIQHLNPVHIGDTLHAETKVLNVRESQTKSDRGIIYVETVASNQNGKEVLSFRRKVLIKKRNDGK